MAKTIVRVHTHGNLINEKIESSKSALLNVYARDG